ncbi:peptidoglycan recognition protein family protein [Acetatifactor muris]|uniref:peptidoglycan recognition protein family protein n=1 Tax=Acetatifactor muris TaxID=879566 RepID=UPI0023F4EC87|nr:N-acetylmuramoyl-L-alanine amidase [Acetatifactor muris]
MLSHDNRAQRRDIYEEADTRRNPYLVDYEQQRNGRNHSGRKAIHTGIHTTVRQNASDREDNRIVQMKSREDVPLAYTKANAGERMSRPAVYRGEEKRGKRVSPGTVLTGGASAVTRRRPSPEGNQEMPVRRRPSPEGNQEMPVRRRPSPEGYQEMPVRRRPSREGNQEMPVRRRPSREGYQEMPVRRRPSREGYQEMPVRRRPSPAGYQKMPSKRPALSRRRKRILMQRLTVSVWLLCILALATALVIRNNRAAAAENGNNPPAQAGDSGMNAVQNPISGNSTQGLPADVFAAHPQWTEDFLTPNEYSRPGDSLETVNNIFVHYTANPGTSAAQNRSYFEQQKDMHEASVSAHFIIGYEGEIIQCVPLDEIAYAVMTRNFDSISIECCYLAEDGSFTQETYDSLISLLAWLTDAYDLDSEDILRHYDCGGKKCPLYYTNNEDEWEQLKMDVDKL